MSSPVDDRSVESRPAVAAVVLAAGSGTRMGGEQNKAYLPLAGRPMVAWTLDAVAQVPDLARIVLVIRPDDRELAEHVVSGQAVDVISGGSSRHESEYKALQYLATGIDDGAIDVVLIHDAARPLAGPGMMKTAVSVAREFGGAIPALAAGDLLRVGAGGDVEAVESRALVRVQTPQAFRAAPLLRAYRDANAAEFEGTDTSSSVEQFTDIEVRTFRGDERNLKVTFAHDVFLAERLLTDAV